MKKCSKCEVEKKITDFNIYRRSKDGRQGYCKGCKKKYNKEWCEDNPKKVIESRKKHYSENREDIIKNVNKYNKEKDSGLLFKYMGMVRRCKYKSQQNYKYYGGRGIKVLWGSYKEFKEDMFSSFINHIKLHGIKNTTLDRLDVNSNYCKENCTWATWKQQANNKR